MTLALRVLVVFATSVSIVRAETGLEPVAALARMPVKEVTVFKDGHAFVVHEGRLTTDANGRVILDRLPAPVLGTFWPYSADRTVKLSSVTASRRRVSSDETALDARGLIAANPGAEVEIIDLDGKTIASRIRSLPSRSVEELEAGGAAASRDLLPARGSIVLLDTAEGVLALPLDRVRAVSFKEPPAATFKSESFRNLLTLSFAWPDGQVLEDIDVGMAYLQKGLRWIPSYRVTIDGAGKARIELQATLVNELVNLEDVNLNLVVGVPSFKFQDMLNPMSLQQTVAALGSYFETGSSTGYALSNAIMSQQMDDSRQRGALAHAGAHTAPDLGPEIAGGAKDEDLYVFSVKRISLKKGERMVLPVAEYDYAYRDVYTLDLPYAPPAEVRFNTSDTRDLELARLLGAPHFSHVLRLTNSGLEPLTTAPALVTSGSRVLGQGLMTYTPPGATCNLGMGTALDIKVTKSDKETGRLPNNLTVAGTTYLRVNLHGRIAVTNRRDEAVDIEVKRSVLGHTDLAGQGGTAEMLGAYEEGGGLALPSWWGWYGWPGWWGAVNGAGRFTWKARIEPGQSLALGYDWHYYWR